MEDIYLKKIQQLEEEITRLKKELQFYKKAATKDFLCQVLNRRGIREEFGIIFEEVKSGQKNKRKKIKIEDFVIVFWEIDNFKKINDTFGHKTGDLVLKNLAQCLKRNFRKIDLVGRWGGDEFLTGIVGSNEKEAYLRVGYAKEKIEKTINKKFQFFQKNIHFSLSCGIVSFKEANPKNLDEMIKKADIVMYWGRDFLGKGKIALYSQFKKYKNNGSNRGN